MQETNINLKVLNAKQILNSYAILVDARAKNFEHGRGDR